MMLNGTCRLCLQEQPLRRSHIIPEFVYRPMYDHEHRFMVLSSRRPEEVLHRRKGLRERLLCGTCEARLARWETYVKEVLYDGKHATGGRTGDVVALQGLNYSMIRLYHLSLLWRMSISTAPLFRSVSLGPHEEKLRLLLARDDPAEPTDYPFWAVIPTIGGTLYGDLILEPEWIRVNGHRLYRVVIGGLLYFFAMTCATIPQNARAALVDKNGRWVLPTTDVASIPYLRQWFAKFAASRPP